MLALKQNSQKVEEKEDLESIYSRLLDEKIARTENLESERHKGKPPHSPLTQHKSLNRVKKNKQRTYLVRHIVWHFCGRAGHIQSRCYFKQRDGKKRFHNL